MRTAEEGRACFLAQQHAKGLITTLRLVNGSTQSLFFVQIDAAKHIVTCKETLHFSNKGSKPVDKLVLCQSADLAPNRAFYEVRSQPD